MKPNYKIFTKKQIQNIVINRRMKEYPLIKNQTYLVFFKFKSYEFAIISEPNKMYSSHYEFYALSTGLNCVSDTGFRSHHYYTEKKVISFKEIEKFWIGYIKDAGFDLLSPVPSRQTSIFEFA
jgi:hypothetical protein